MTRIAFTADLHVDSYGSKVDPATGLNARLVDFLATVRWTAEEAARRECHALVVAGDFTERRHPAPWLVNQIGGALEAFPSRRIYLRGNHDGEKAAGSIVNVLWPRREDDIDGPDGAGYGGFSRPGLAKVTKDAVLALLPYLDRHWLRAQPEFTTAPEAEIYRILGEQFLAIARGLYAQAKAEHPDAGVVLVCHQTLSGGRMSATQEAFLGDLSLVVDSRALQAIGFEAVVAGHLHQHQVVLPALPMFGTPEGRGVPGPVLYPGSIERVDFGEEGETKGFVVADVGPGRFEWEFVESPARRFVTLTGGQMIDRLDAGEIEGAIVRVLDVGPDADAAELRRSLELAGAFEVTEIRRRPVEAAVATGGMAEGLSAEQALDAYFADDPDREPLVERGRQVLAEVAG